MIRFGLCFTAGVEQPALAHIGHKKPVYVRLLELAANKGWESYVVSRREYQGHGCFGGGWRYAGTKFVQVSEQIKIDVVYDRTGGVTYPPEEENGPAVVNNRAFKVYCWNKWLAYQDLKAYSPQTVWVGHQDQLGPALNKLTADKIVLKPVNGLKGLGIFIGSKAEAGSFQFDNHFSEYIAQEFVETAKGIPGLVEGRHDLRIVVVNGQVVWAHVRTPPRGSLKANVAQGGTIREVDYDGQVPGEIKEIVKTVTKMFDQKYSNPIFSVDFGMSQTGPKIFEINDQIGFPTWGMKNRDKFLLALIENFESKLT